MRVLQVCIDKEAKGICCKGLIQAHLQDIFVIALRCLSTFQSFRLQGKPDPDNIIESKKNVSKIFKQLQALSDEKDEDFLTNALPPVIDDVFCTCHEQMIS